MVRTEVKTGGLDRATIANVKMRKSFLDDLCYIDYQLGWLL